MKIKKICKHCGKIFIPQKEYFPIGSYEILKIPSLGVCFECKSKMQIIKNLKNLDKKIIEAKILAFKYKKLLRGLK
jgi:hypothetical protein